MIQKVPDDDSAYERRAFAYRNLKKYKEAIADYSKTIAKDPKDPEGYRRRASTHTLAGDNKSAAADFQALLKIKPDDVDAQSRLKALETRANSSPAATSPAPRWIARCGAAGPGLAGSVAAIELAVQRIVRGRGD